MRSEKENTFNWQVKLTIDEFDFLTALAQRVNLLTCCMAGNSDGLNLTIDGTVALVLLLDKLEDEIKGLLDRAERITA